MKTPVTSESLKQHMTYSWWKYVIVMILSVLLVNLLYTVTAYRSPPEKEVNFYVYGQMSQENLSEYMEEVRRSEMPDMEVMAPVQLLDDNNYGAMQLMTYLAVGEGDLYLLPREEFLTVVSSDAFVALDEDAELLAIFDAADISLQSGWRKNAETGETHLYGIPQNKLPGLSKYASARDGFLCVPQAGGNVENTMKFLRILCRDMLQE